MTSLANRSSSPLRDVLYEFSMAKDVPDAELLDQFVKAYPEYAAMITDFAIDIAVDALRSKASPAVEAAATVSPEVSRAMSVYQNALYAKSMKAKAATVESKAESEATDCPNLFAGLDRKGFRALAARLKMDTVLLMKLRDRLIDPRTITEGFRQYLAEGLNVTKKAVDAFFAEKPTRLAPQFYKSESKPELQAPQSFEEAVRAAGLDDAQKTFLLEL